MSRPRFPSKAHERANCLQALAICSGSDRIRNSPSARVCVGHLDSSSQQRAQASGWQFPIDLWIALLTQHAGYCTAWQYRPAKVELQPTLHLQAPELASWEAVNACASLQAGSASLTTPGASMLDGGKSGWRGGFCIPPSVHWPFYPDRSLLTICRRRPQNIKTAVAGKALRPSVLAILGPWIDSSVALNGHISRATPRPTITWA